MGINELFCSPPPAQNNTNMLWIVLFSVYVARYESQIAAVGTKHPQWEASPTLSAVAAAKCCRQHGWVVWSAVFMATRDREVAGLTLDCRGMLLRLWERRFTIIFSAWRILTSSKFRKVKTQSSAESELWNWKSPKQVWTTRPMYNATVVFPWMEDKNGLTN